MTRMRRARVLAGGGRRWLPGWLVPVTVAALVPALTGMAAPPGGLATGHDVQPRAQRQVPVPVHKVAVHPARRKPVKVWHQPPVSWPAVGHAAVSVAAAPASAPAAVPRDRANITLARPSAGAVRAGRLPVWVSQAAPAAGNAARQAPAPAGRVSVRMASRAAATAAGVRGVIFSVTGPAASRAMRLHLSLDYQSFAEAYGGDYASRLRLVTLPACALTTPKVAACRVQHPLHSGNDVPGTRLGADVTIPAGSGSAPDLHVTGRTVVIAASTSTSGSGGSFSATALSEAGTWSEGGSSGAFTYDYPIAVPPVPGGLAPQVSLDYNSQAVDGLTSSSNNQASWVGDGWDYQPGYIERDYETCSQDTLTPAIPAADKTGDLCWSSNNVTTLSLNGVTTTLVDDPTNGWHAEADNGEQVQYDTGTGNGTYDGGYWVVTDPDGTSYYFGLTLPGYSSSAGDTPAQAAWGVPVYCPRSTNPSACYNATFADSHANMAWRWQLDYVVDSHNDAMAYLYNREVNYYGADNATTGTQSYDQGGSLATIVYGFRASSNIYGSAKLPPGAAEVNFTTAEDRTDIPTDLACANGGTCDVNSPSFWAKYQLTTIATQATNSSGLAPVDSWALTQDYAATGDPDNPAPLWLESIKQTGEDGGSAPLPAVSFTPDSLPNRAVNPENNNDGYSIIDRNRLQEITNETGGTITVSYLDPSGGCTSGVLPSPDANTLNCFPVYWAGQSSGPSWFNKYVVQQVSEADTTGDGSPDVTNYTYSGAAWHYNDDSLTRSSQRTWDQWRGFQTVTTETGASPDPITKTVDTYFQGMNGDYQSTGTVSLTSTVGDVTATDSDQWAGMDFEHAVYNGAGGPIVTDTVTTPWSSAATATQSQPSPLPSLNAYMTGTQETQTFTALASGGYREAYTINTFNSSGQVTSVADVPHASDNGVGGDPSEDTCTQTTYAENTSTGLLDLPEEVIVTNLEPSACPVTGTPTAAELISDTRTYYDGATTLATDTPTAGDITETQKATSYSGMSEVFTTESTSTYDEYGRVLTSTDANGHTTATAYSPATGAEPTSITVTDPMNLITTTTYDPLLDLPLTVTNPAGLVTTETYDPLGRLTAVWTPGNSGAANYKFSYSVSNTAPSVVTSDIEQPTGAYQVSETLYDSLGRVREAQTETADGNRLISDTSYNSDGWPELVSAPYYTTGAPSATLVAAPSDQVPSQTGYVYDGAGRKIAQISYALANETWETDTSYGGNETTVSYVSKTTPVGGTAETTYVNGDGQASYLYQYHGPTAPATLPAPGAGSKAGSWDQTAYTYTKAQQLATITDDASNTWSYAYNLSGDQTSATDPDTGTTTSAYDPAGNLLSATRQDGSTISYTYDKDNRKTGEYAATVANQGSANQLASWTYDTIDNGMLTSSTSYVGGSGSSGQAYTEQVTGYNGYGLPTGTETTIPTGPLAGTYITEDSYKPTGQLSQYSDGAAGGLPAETVGLSYDNAGQPTSMGGTWDYVNNLSYTELGQPLEYQMGTSAEPAYLTDFYSQQTGQLTEAQTETGTTPQVVDDQHYTYNNVGDVLSEADTPASGPAQVQCFQYDYLGRLTTAWSQGSSTCAATPTQSAEAAAAAPYWDAYTYNNENDLTSEVSTPAAGAATTYTSAFPATTGATGPHAIASQTTTGPGGTSTTSYGYDTDGQTTKITAPAGTSNLNWNALGQLSSITSGSSDTPVSSYVYDADGNLLLQTDPDSQTLYLPDEQITANTTTTPATLSGVRYYAIGGVTIAARTSAGQVEYLIGDQQGTAGVAIDSQTLAVTRRYYDPFGNPIGTAPSSWPGTRGFVGGSTDPVTGLTNLGAREYNPATGSFISPDALLSAYNPQDLNPYAYASDSPATLSDPTGYMPCDGDVCGSFSYLEHHDPYPTDNSSGRTDPSSDWYYATFHVISPQLAGYIQPPPVVRTSRALAPHQASAGGYDGEMCAHTGTDCEPAGAQPHGKFPPWVLIGGLGIGAAALTIADALQLGLDPITDAADGADIAELADLTDTVTDTDPVEDPADGPTCGGESFTATTKILLASGAAIPISQLKPGDKVMATSTKTGKTQPETVTAVLLHHDTNRYNLKVRAGHKTATIHTTRSHLFYDLTQQRWIKVAALPHGDHLRTAHGATVTVVSGHAPARTAGWMWDLTVPGNNDHDFYVDFARATVLVHNCDFPGEDARAKVPSDWGDGEPNAKGTGQRWTDPDYQGNGIRIDQGNPDSPYPSQQVDHVVVRTGGTIIGPDGSPIEGPLRMNPSAHIPLVDWLEWAAWNEP